MLIATELETLRSVRQSSAAPGVAAAVATPRRCGVGALRPRDSCPGNFVALAASTATATAPSAPRPRRRECTKHTGAASLDVTIPTLFR